jgi:hypothetical protein
MECGGVSRAMLWKKGEAPKLDLRVVEGDSKFSILGG